MAPIHIDESIGSDETGKGTPEAPYQTLAFAVYSSPEGPYAIRKDASGTYEEPTQSALKKAKKGADGIEKKRKKAEELVEREAKERAEARERKEKKLEESKKIVLEEDPALPAAVKVRAERISTSTQRVDILAVEDREPHPPEVKTHPNIRMGPPSPRPKGDHLRRPSRWHWLPAMCPFWQGRADVRCTHSHARVHDRSSGYAQGRTGRSDCTRRARTGRGLLAGARCSTRWR